MRSPSPTTMLTLSRTSGLMSPTRVPSGRMICTACQTPASEAITWRTRRILGPGIGVDLGEQLGLGREIDRAERVVLGIEAAVGADRRRHHRAALPRLHRPHRLSGAADRGFRELRGMGIAGRFAGDGAQPEALGGVEGGAFDAAVVERDAFGLAVFEEELAIVHAGERFADERLDPAALHPGAGEEEIVSRGEIGHLVSFAAGMTGARGPAL